VTSFYNAEKLKRITTEPDELEATPR
jgi:hypothetical protein